jgi:hypothetical protein
VEMFHVTVSPDTYNGGPYLADIPAIRTTVNTPATFTISAIDVEGDAVTFSGVKSGSVNYTFSVNSQSGAVTVSPPAGYVGTMDVLLRVKAAGTTDTADTYDSQLVSIGVAPAAPGAVDLVPASDSGYLNTDNLTNLTDLTFEVTGVTSGAQVRLYRGSAMIGQATASGISVTITTAVLASLGDGTHNVYATQIVNSVESGASSPLTVVLDRTIPPAFTSTPPTSAAIATQLIYDAQNPEEGTAGAAYSLTSAPAGVSINATSGLLTWTPTGSQLGANTFAIVMTDAAGNSRSQDLNILVAADALMAFRLEVASTSGTPVSSIDVGGDFLLRVFVQDLRAQAYGVFAAFLDVLYNQQLVAVNGLLSYGASFPNQPVGSLATAGLIDEAGAVAGITELGGSEYLLWSLPMRAIHAGAASFTSDPADDVPINEVLLFRTETGLPSDDINFGSTLLTVNPAFGANDNLFPLDEDSPSTSLNPLANVEVFEGSTGSLIITAVGAPNHGGSVTIATDGKTVNYVPASNFFGDETFSYTVSDGTGDDTAMVTVRVAPMNDDPTAVNDVFTVTEDAVSIALTVLANDLMTPDSGETLQVLSFSGLSAGGTLTIPVAKDRLLYTPADNFFGTETFTYTISDGNGGTSSATVAVTVTEANDPPLAQDDLFQVTEDSTNNTLNVLANDSTQGDAGETLTIVSTTTPDQGGAVTVAQGGLSLVYAPKANFFGTERLQYTISDGNGGTAQASIVVTVQASNDPPTANNDSFTVVKNTTGNLLDVLANDNSQPDAFEVLTISAVGTCSAGGAVSIVSSGTKIQYAPLAGFTGTETFTYTIQDPSGATAVATATVTVSNYIPSKLSGYAYIDTNNNGVKETGETPLGGIVITLSGQDENGGAVNVQKTTDALGFYQFTNLAPGPYVLSQTQPMFLLDGIDSGGTLGTSTGPDQLTVNLQQNVDGQNLNFGERGRISQHITVFDFLASTPRETVLATATADGVGQWYAVEGGWSHAKTLQFQLQTNQMSAKLDVTTADSQQYSTMLNFLAPQQVQHLGSNSVAQILRVVGAPAVLFPGADCACAGEGEADARVVRASNDAEGESATEAYLATDLLMAEAASSTTDSLGIEPLLRDLQDDDENYPGIVDGILAELSEESLPVGELLPV